MKRIWATVLATVLLAGCGTPAGLTSDYSKNERLQALLDAEVSHRDVARHRLYTSPIEEERSQLREIILAHNRRIAAFKVEMGYPPGPVEPVLASDTVEQPENPPLANSVAPVPPVGAIPYPYSSGPVHTGPRGGRYTITPSGNKRYLPRK